MNDLRERVAYLQGLAEGLKLEEGNKEAKIIRHIIDILADLVDEVENLHVAQEDLESYLESLDEDLFDTGEEEVEEVGDVAAEGEGGEGEEGVGELSKDELNYIEAECPKCHDIICFEEDIINDEDVVEVTCPNCNEVVFVNDGSMPLPKGYEVKQEEKEKARDPFMGEEEDL